MYNKMTKLRIFFIVVVAVLVGLTKSTIAAQSTVDVGADTKMKEQLRREIIGENVFPGEEKVYVVGYGDVLDISIYGEGSMAASTASSVPSVWDSELQGGREGSGNVSGGVVVRTDGMVSLLHLGDVKVVGMTLTQLADYLKKLYATIYSDPMVTAVLLQSKSRRYTVMGEVRNPGVFQIDYPITIVQTVARSGGFTEWANHDITVVRAGDGIKTSASENGKNTIKFDYDDLVKDGKLEQNIFIRSGDIIIVH